MPHITKDTHVFILSQVKFMSADILFFMNMNFLTWNFLKILTPQFSALLLLRLSALLSCLPPRSPLFLLPQLHLCSTHALQHRSKPSVTNHSLPSSWPNHFLPRYRLPLPRPILLALSSPCPACLSWPCPLLPSSLPTSPTILIFSRTDQRTHQALSPP